MYFGLEVIQEYSCGAGWPCETSMPLVREFLHGDPERYPEQVAMIRHNPDTQDQWTYHYLHGVLGSVIGVVNEAGTLVERYTYDPYGKVFIEKWDAAANEGSGAWVERASECGTGVPACGQMPYSPTGNPFLWTGHRYDAAVGLYHTLFRTYSPTLGRWLQRDPIEYEAGSVNLYEYAVSSPLASIDPLGLETRVAKGNCSAPPSDEYQQDKCRAAANKALSNCLESEKAGGAGAPTKDNCFKSFTQSMDACARGKPGTHEETVLLDSDWLDCFEKCVALGTQLCLGAGPIAGRAAQMDVPRKHVEASKRGTERLVSRLLVPKNKTLRRLLGGKRLTRFIRATRGFGGGVFWGALAVGECVAAVEVGCAAQCAGE